MVDASRLAEIADQELQSADRKGLVGRLQHYRGSLALSPAELREADTLAAKVAALDQLADRRRAVDDECDGLEARVELLRDRIFETRREPATASAVTAEVDALWMRVDELRRNLRAAVQEVRGLSVGLTKRAEPRPPPSQTPMRGLERFGRMPRRAVLAQAAEEGRRSGVVSGGGHSGTPGSPLQRLTSHTCAASNAERQATCGSVHPPRRMPTAGAPAAAYRARRARFDRLASLAKRNRPRKAGSCCPPSRWTLTARPPHTD
jgi:hypothetical protein